MPTMKDLSGQKFSRLTVLYSKRIDNRKSKWLCLCECGEYTYVSSNSLTSGTTKSCGCKKREFIIDFKTKHGLSRSPEYGIWLAMKSRCSDVKHISYKNYGGRGILVCEEWEDFNTFILDMKPRPSPKYTLERVDNNKGYSPENCVWATRVMQLRNTRRNNMITHLERTQCLSAWADEFGIKYSLLRHRLKRGWSISDALSEPVAARYSEKIYSPKRFFTINDETMCLAEWARKYGIKNTTLSSRIKRGMDIIEALEAPVKK